MSVRSSALPPLELFGRHVLARAENHPVARDRLRLLGQIAADDRPPPFGKAEVEQLGAALGRASRCRA